MYKVLKKYFQIKQSKLPKFNKTSFLYRRFAFKCAAHHKFEKKIWNLKTNLCVNNILAFQCYFKLLPDWPEASGS